MTYSPSRGRAKRKWAVDKLSGPQRFVAELIQKKLIQHCWPCQVEDVRHYSVFKADRFREIHSDFDEALDVAARIVCGQLGVNYDLYNRAFKLEGEYYLTDRGRIKPCVKRNISTSETLESA